LEGTTADADEASVRLMHKFYLGQPVEYRPMRGIDAPRGSYIVTAKLPEREGEFEYVIRNINEAHERAALESELRALDNRALG
jgi:hypothetical protein